MSQAYKNYLEDTFIQEKLPSICLNSESLEEAISKAKRLRNTGYDHLCSEKELCEYMPDVWNIVWEKYNV
jgi:hypothetical protein